MAVLSLKTVEYIDKLPLVPIGPPDLYFNKNKLLKQDVMVFLGPILRVGASLAGIDAKTETKNFFYI